MQHIDNFFTSLPAACLVAAIIGATAAYATAYAADVAETLEEDQALLPEIARSFLRGGVANSGRRYATVITAIVCGSLPLWSTISIPILAVLIALAVPASIMDIRLLIIPEEFTWALLFTGALLSPWNSGAEDAILGAAVSAGVMWTTMTALEYRTGLPLRAGGDVAAAAAGGAWVGMFASGMFILVACAIFTAYTFLTSTSSKGHRWVPMGPALLAAIPLAPVTMPIVEAVAMRAL
jgi:hypothetical protein